VIDRIDDGATHEEIEELLAYVQTSVGIHQSRQAAQDFVDRAVNALQVFPPSDYRASLEGIAWSTLARQK
jgi:geranylgeranyl pyrophosphate synthase